jgi:hypothetical protein
LTEASLVCAFHPDRVTSLRCNRCDKLICISCAVQTPVGYRCRECVRGQQAAFETANNLHLAAAAIVAAAGAGIAVALLSSIGFFGLLIAPLAGGGIAEVVRWSVRGSRSRRLPWAAAAGAASGVLIYGVISIAPPLLLFGLNFRLLASAGIMLLWPAAYGALMIGTLYARLKGIRL